MTALGFSPAGITQKSCRLVFGTSSQLSCSCSPQHGELPAFLKAFFFFSFLVDLGNYTKSPEPPGSQMCQVRPNLAQEEQGWQPPTACGRAPCGQGHPVAADPLSAPTFPPDRQTAGLAQSPKKLSLIPIHIYFSRGFPKGSQGTKSIAWPPAPRWQRRI